MKTRTSSRLLVACALLALGSAAHAATMTVYKSASCGCCAKWVEHVQKHGFTVKVVNVDDIIAVEVHGGPASLPLIYAGTSTSCTTVLIWTSRA